MHCHAPLFALLQTGVLAATGALGAVLAFAPLVCLPFGTGLAEAVEESMANVTAKAQRILEATMILEKE